MKTLKKYWYLITGGIAFIAVVIAKVCLMSAAGAKAKLKAAKDRTKSLLKRQKIDSLKERANEAESDRRDLVDKFRSKHNPDSE